MSTTASAPVGVAPTAGAGTPVLPARAAAETTPAVKVWAWVGGILLVLELYFLGKWVFGDAFTAVDSGPDDPPAWMTTTFDVLQPLLVVAMLATLYHFIVRPWLRERRVTTDGLLCIAFLTAAPFDPISNWGQMWFTYNSELFNRGSVVGELPAALGSHGPGVGEAWPFVIAPIYVTVFIWLAMLVCWMMRAVQRRFPGIGTVRIIAICLGITMFADVVIEGLGFVRLGFYNFAGGHWLINGGHYYQFPIQEMIFGGAVFASFCCLRYFTNDKGETIAERGTDRLRTTPARKNVIRGLAVIGAVHLGFLVTYHLPTGIFALDSTRWPEDVATRSYFANGVCGPLANRACPGPETPNPRQNAPYLDYSGKLVQPR